jgi:hypothetical protein
MKQENLTARPGIPVLQGREDVNGRGLRWRTRSCRQSSGIVCRRWSGRR